MLSRKTLGVAGAAILGSVALLATNSANAVINLDPDTRADPAETAGKVTIANETLLKGDANTTTVGGVTHYNITNTGNVLDIQFDRGVRSDVSVYYRVTLENMVFAADMVANVAAETGDASHVAGGASGDNYIIFSAEGGPATSTSNLTVRSATLAVLPGAPGAIKVEVYRDSFDALGPTNAVESLTKTMADAVAVVDGISERGTSGNSVASVQRAFTQFVGDDDPVQIGRLRIEAKTGVTGQDGTAIAMLDDMLNEILPIEITFKGDFSTGTASLDGEDDCNGVAGETTNSTVIASTVADDGDVEDGKLTPDDQPDGMANIDWYLCLSVDEENKDPLPTGGVFTATMKYAALENANGRADQTVTIGSIGRDGASAYMPYLTTDDRYNQRIIIVNHGGAAGYSMIFSSESGIMATPGTLASGTLDANSTTVLKATDVVTISGGPPHRVSALLSIVGTKSDISVATNQTTKMGGSTDTVVYEVMGM